MIFYRSRTEESGDGPSIRTLRLLVTTSLLAYPAGALVLRLAEGLAAPVIGYALIALALFAAAPVLGSRLQKVVADQARRLDEFELALRHRALSWGYSVIGAALLVAILYFGVASDSGLWVPDDYEEFNALFWGTFLYVALLPTAFLAWTTGNDDDSDEVPDPTY